MLISTIIKYHTILLSRTFKFFPYSLDDIAIKMLQNIVHIKIWNLANLKTTLNLVTLIQLISVNSKATNYYLCLFYCF